MLRERFLLGGSLSSRQRLRRQRTWLPASRDSSSAAILLATDGFHNVLRATCGRLAGELQRLLLVLSPSPEHGTSTEAHQEGAALLQERPVARTMRRPLLLSCLVHFHSFLVLQLINTQRLSF